MRTVGSESMPPNEEKLSDLRSRKARAAAGGGAARVEAQHKRGKLTARERLELLVDEGTFHEIDSLDSI